MRTVIHVNQHIIRKNQRGGDCQPPITVRTYKSVDRCSRAVIYGQDGQPAAEVVYSPDAPLSCGARVWVEVLGTVTTD